ncbi:MAG: LolA family protein [Bacteroidales bacterium]
MKFIKIFISILFLLPTSSLLSQQSAEAILRSAEEQFNKDKGVKALFSMSVETINSNQRDSYDGSITMFGSCFYIKSADIESWFDGTTLWTHILGSGEVNITKPSSVEIDAMNPSVLFKLYKSGFAIKTLGEKSVKGKTISMIELTPKQSKIDLREIVVGVDAQRHISEIQMRTKDGVKTVVVINKYQSGFEFSKSDFQFNSTLNPSLEIVDLR